MGVLRADGQIDEHALSPTERRDILAKMSSEVCHASASGVVRVEAQVEAGVARVRVVPPNGKATEASAPTDIRIEGEGTRASGRFAISLSAIGSDAVKGPLGAFRVKDRVLVSFDVVFVPAAG